MISVPLFREISKNWDRGISRSPGSFFTTDSLSADNITGVFIKDSMLPSLTRVNVLELQEFS